MARRSRTRRVLKWVGVALCVAVVALAVVTMRWRIRWQSASKNYGGVAFDGAVGVFWVPSNPLQIVNPSPAGWAVDVLRPSWSGTLYGWSQAALLPKSGWNLPARYVSVPLWLAFLLVMLPTAVLWRRSRGSEPGLCSFCGYDLTGNISGRCPECGEAT